MATDNSIDIVKTDILTGDWQRVVFTKGIYLLSPNKDNSICMRIGNYTNAKTYIAKNFILEVTELEQYFEFKANEEEAYFYRIDLNELRYFIETVEAYRDDFTQFVNKFNKITQPQIEGLTQELENVKNRLSTAESNIQNLQGFQTQATGELANHEQRITALENK